MNITANNVASKLFVAFVAAAMLFTLATPAKAATAEELQAQINALMAQISSLQGQTSTPAAGCTFTRALTVGSEGADVKCLQDYLTPTYFTNAGGSTGYFGAVTGAAVAAWQTANGISPAAGYFGPVSQAKYAALVAATPATDDSDDSDDDSDDDSTSGDLQGEGTLDDSENDLDEASDTDLMEGEEDAEIATLTLAAQDGDILVSRLDFVIVDASVDDPGVGGVDTLLANDEDIWDTLETIALWVDGDMVAEFDASDEDEYLDEDDGTFRISGLDIVIEEDEEVEIEITATVAGSVDGSDTADLADWTLDVTDIRYFDADDVASTEGLTGVTPADFEIVEEGVDDIASIESDSNTPDAATLKVDDGSDESDEFELHHFTIEVDEDSSDLVFNEMAFATVQVTGSGATGAGVTADDVIDAVYMTIDGETVEGDDVSGLNGTIAVAAVANVVYEFDFDGMELESDTDYDVTIAIVFKGQDGSYDNGVTVQTIVTGSTWELEGLADDNVLTDSDSSEIMTLASVVPEITDVTSDVDRNETGDAGTISFEFTIAAEDDDVVLNFTDVDGNINGANDDIRFSVSPVAGGSFTSALTLVSGDADVDTTANTVTVADGDEATFVLDVTFVAASAAGTYRVNLDTIGGVEIDETSTGLSI